MELVNDLKHIAYNSRTVHGQVAAQKDYQETGKWKELQEEKARGKDIIK